MHRDQGPHSCHLPMITGHLSRRQSLVSVHSPEQEPRPPMQALALILAPLPHEREQWDHSPHPCHLPVISSTDPSHSSSRQSLISEGSPEQDPRLPLQALALILEQELEHLDHSLHPCHSFSTMHSSKRQSFVSVHFPEQDPSLPLQARAQNSQNRHQK